MPTASIDDEFLSSLADHLRSHGFRRPRTAIILGSGLGGYAQGLVDPISLPLSTIPGYPASTVSGHAGYIHYGSVRSDARLSKPLLVFQGRIHPYEGGKPPSFALNVRLARALGVRQLFITNAAGGIRSDLLPGTLMLHTGIMKIPNLYISNKIPVEPSASTTVNKTPYSDRLNVIIRRTSGELGIRLAGGVYCYVTGPSYETPSEVRMMRIIGADAVGMSTYPEVAEAASVGLPVTAISLISNQASGISGQPLSHNEVTAVAGKAGIQLARLITNSILALE